MLNRNLSDFLESTKVKCLTEKMSRSKKAISPILATLLLVVIAVAAIVVTYAWVMTYMTHTTGQAGVVLYKANVSWPNNSTIDIDVGNSGTSDTTIIQVYIGTSSSTMDNQTITPVSLPAGGNPVRIIVNHSWQNGITYYFKVLVSSGQSLPLIEQAPVS